MTLLPPGLAPATLIASNQKVMLDFIAKHPKVVIKPLEECSGRGIHFLSRDEAGLEQRVKELLQGTQGSSFLIVQEYIEAVSQGDKRVFLVDGKPYGMVNRIPKDEHSLGNIHMGARCEKTSLSAKEAKAIEIIGPLLKEHGIFMAGVDFIGERLTEVNVTSPSALRQINQVEGRQWQGEIVTALLNKIEEHQRG